MSWWVRVCKGTGVRGRVVGGSGGFATESIPPWSVEATLVPRTLPKENGPKRKKRRGCFREGPLDPWNW